METSLKRVRITVKGIVQGVGFRPAMAKQALSMGLKGKVLNTRDSVEIEIQGEPETVKKYTDSFYSFIPENAVISFFKLQDISVIPGEKEFVIIESREHGADKIQHSS